MYYLARSVGLKFFLFRALCTHEEDSEARVIIEEREKNSRNFKRISKCRKFQSVKRKVKPWDPVQVEVWGWGGDGV